MWTYRDVSERRNIHHGDSYFQALALLAICNSQKFDLFDGVRIILCDSVFIAVNTSITNKMPTQELAIPQPPATENEENNVPSSQPIVGIIYPPPEVRSILCQERYQNMKTTFY